MLKEALPKVPVGVAVKLNMYFWFAVTVHLQAYCVKKTIPLYNFSHVLYYMLF